MLIGAILTSSVAASAQSLFLDNFEVDSSTRYTITADTDSLALFAYDYSAMGIPAAPNSVPGTTRGLRLEANHNDTVAAAAALSLSPTGLSIPGDYTLRFDMWINANGPFPAGGTGSTEYVTAGVGTAGNSNHKVSAGDGTWFAVDGEGNSTADFRVYLSGNLQTAASGLYSAGTGTAPDARDSANPYYSNFIGQAPPLLQQTNFPQQTGTLQTGSVGFAWRQIEITKIGTRATWSIDGLLISDVAAATLAGNNVFVGYYDIFSSISDNPALSFGLIDNLRVNAIPEPATAGLALMGAGTLLGLRRQRR